MNNQNLIVYRLNPLYKILKELEGNFEFKIIEILDEKSLDKKIKDLNQFLIITNKKISILNNQFMLDQSPIKISQLIEKLNIRFLKQQFFEQSQVRIKNYTIDINARKMLLNNTSLKLTEKEVNTIIYLFKKTTTVSINELQTNVWDYHSDIETHTVETHIYRLRKKISKIFLDDKFIISRNNGYEIKY